MLCQRKSLQFHGTEKFAWYPITDMETVFSIWQCFGTSGCELNHWGICITCLKICSSYKEINLFKEKQDIIKVIFLWVCTTLKKHSKSWTSSCFVLKFQLAYKSSVLSGFSSSFKDNLQLTVLHSNTSDFNIWKKSSFFFHLTPQEQCLMTN